MKFVQVIFITVVLFATVRAVHSVVSPHTSHMRDENVKSDASSITNVIGKRSSATVGRQVVPECDDKCEVFAEACSLQCSGNNRCLRICLLDLRRSIRGCDVSRS